MTEKEKALIIKYLDSNDVMLEWGSGGSTLEFSKYVKKYYSVEHDANWFENMTPLLPPDTNIFIHHVPQNDPRLAGDWPRLRIPTQYEKFETYINFVDTLNIKYDKVLIDGRARQWCAEKVIKYLNDDAVVFIHDFYHPDREEYQSVLEYFDVVESITELPSLVVLKKK